LVTLPPRVGAIWEKIKPYILLKSFKDFNPKRALHLRLRALPEGKDTKRRKKHRPIFRIRRIGEIKKAKLPGLAGDVF